MKFDVRAIDRNSRVVNMVVDADDAAAATARVSGDGLAVLRVKAAGGLAWRNLIGGTRFPLTLFTQELVTLLLAGLSVVEAVETLREKESRHDRRELLGRLVAQLYEGQSLSSAMERFPDAFPNLYVATVRASERTGDLSEALGRYVTYQAQLDQVRKKIVSASIYPLVLLIVGTLVIAFLLGYVVPRFARLFADVGHDLPYLSRLLIDWGRLVADHGSIIGLAAVVFVAGAATWLRLPASRQLLLGWVLALPGIGARMRIYQLARFYRTLGMLLRGGIPIMSALGMTAGLLQTDLRRQLTTAGERIREGVAISAAMDAGGLTTPVAMRMLRVGERTGQMGEMMERIAEFYDEEIARWVDWFVRLFEPLLMTVIGVAIGGIVVLMYFPIFELAGSVQ